MCLDSLSWEPEVDRRHAPQAVLEGVGSGKATVTVRIARPSMWPTVTPPWLLRAELRPEDGVVRLERGRAGCGGRCVVADDCAGVRP